MSIDLEYCKTFPCGHLFKVATFNGQFISFLSCKILFWSNLFKRSSFSSSQKWSLNTTLTVYRSFWFKLRLNDKWFFHSSRTLAKRGYECRTAKCSLRLFSGLILNRNKLGWNFQLHRHRVTGTYISKVMSIVL